jgi:hypothetical protein
MESTSLLPRLRRAAAVAAGLAVFLAASAAVRAGGSEKIQWEAVDGAQVKIDEKVPLAWNAYQVSKKDKKKYGDLVLVLLGHRYILLDTKTKLAYEVEVSDLQKEGDNFESGDLRETSRQIPSIDWSMRDVGPEELIQVKLQDYGRQVTVSIPHPPDLRAFY